MNFQEIKERARDFGIKTSRISKAKLIQTIQRTEGNFDCFASAENSECDQMKCIWREDCFAAAKKMHS